MRDGGTSLRLRASKEIYGQTAGVGAELLLAAPRAEIDDGECVSEYVSGCVRQFDAPAARDRAKPHRGAPHGYAEAVDQSESKIEPSCARSADESVAQDRNDVAGDAVTHQVEIWDAQIRAAA